MLEEDPRAQLMGRCRITKTVGRIEWICIRQVHDVAYIRKAKNYRRGNLILNDSRTSESHYFVPRWVQLNEESEHEGVDSGAKP